MQILKPQRLKQGDIVGIISPSEPVLPELRPQFDRAVLALKEFGLEVKIGRHVFDHHYYNAGTREDRIQDFNDMWADPSVKMILMSQGGETANHLLDGIDYELIRRNPKIIAGISDGTTLLNAIFARTGLVTYHGPDLLWTFGRQVTLPFKENFVNTFFLGEVGTLSECKNWAHQEKAEVRFEGRRCLRSGKASGVLSGGHSGCLSNTILAGYGPDFSNALLFLEGTDDVGHLDRQCTALRLCGVFDRIQGLILGWFEGSALSDERKNRTVAEMVLEVTKDYHFPILQIGELGHNVENYIFPIGCEAAIDAGSKLLSITEPTVI